MNKVDDNNNILLDLYYSLGFLLSLLVHCWFQREDMWSGWKNDGCPEFKKPESVDKTKARQNGKGDEVITYVCIVEEI